MKLIEILILIGIVGGVILGRAWVVGRGSFRKSTWMFLLVLILSLPILNIGAFIAVAAYLGGDAVNGRIQDGHYFLFSHGKYTEVSEAVFNFSRIHAYSVFLTVAFYGLAILIVALLQGLAWVLGRKGYIRR